MSECVLERYFGSRW